MSPETSTKSLTRCGLALAIVVAVFAASAANAASANSNGPTRFYSDAGSTLGFLPPAAYYGGGYRYLPGRGIVDEACDLPTSACPDTARASY